MGTPASSICVRRCGFAAVVALLAVCLSCTVASAEELITTTLPLETNLSVSMSFNLNHRYPVYVSGKSGCHVKTGSKIKISVSRCDNPIQTSERGNVPRILQLHRLRVSSGAKFTIDFSGEDDCSDDKAAPVMVNLTDVVVVDGGVLVIVGRAKFVGPHSFLLIDGMKGISTLGTGKLVGAAGGSQNWNDDLNCPFYFVSGSLEVTGGATATFNALELSAGASRPDADTIALAFFDFDIHVSRGSAVVFANSKFYVSTFTKPGVGVKMEDTSVTIANGSSLEFMTCTFITGAQQGTARGIQVYAFHTKQKHFIVEGGSSFRIGGGSFIAATSGLRASIGFYTSVSNFFVRDVSAFVVQDTRFTVSSPAGKFGAAISAPKIIVSNLSLILLDSLKVQVTSGANYMFQFRSSFELRSESALHLRNSSFTFSNFQSDKFPVISILLWLRIDEHSSMSIHGVQQSRSQNGLVLGIEGPTEYSEEHGNGTLFFRCVYNHGNELSQITTYWPHVRKNSCTGRGICKSNLDCFGSNTDSFTSALSKTPSRMRTGNPLGSSPSAHDWVCKCKCQGKIPSHLVASLPTSAEEYAVVPLCGPDYRKAAWILHERRQHEDGNYFLLSTETVSSTMTSNESSSSSVAPSSSSSSSQSATMKVADRVRATPSETAPGEESETHSISAELPTETLPPMRKANATKKKARAVTAFVVFMSEEQATGVQASGSTAAGAVAVASPTSVAYAARTQAVVSFASMCHIGADDKGKGVSEPGPVEQPFAIIFQSKSDQDRLEEEEGDEGDDPFRYAYLLRVHYKSAILSSVVTLIPGVVAALLARRSSSPSSGGGFGSGSVASVAGRRPFGGSAVPVYVALLHSILFLYLTTTIVHSCVIVLRFANPLMPPDERGFATNSAAVSLGVVALSSVYIGWMVVATVPCVLKRVNVFKRYPGGGGGGEQSSGHPLAGGDGEIHNKLDVALYAVSADDEDDSEANLSNEQHPDKITGLFGLFCDREHSVAVAKWLQPYYDASSDLTRLPVRGYFAEELLVNVLLGGVAACAGPKTCTQVGALLVVISLLHAIYLIAFRPYRSKIEMAFAGLQGILLQPAMYIAVTATASGQGGEGSKAAQVMAVVGLMSNLMFPVQGLFLAGWSLRRQLRKKSLKRSQAAEDAVELEQLDDRTNIVDRRRRHHRTQQGYRHGRRRREEEEEEEESHYSDYEEEYAGDETGAYSEAPVASPILRLPKVQR